MIRQDPLVVGMALWTSRIDRSALRGGPDSDYAASAKEPLLANTWSRIGRHLDGSAATMSRRRDVPIRTANIMIASAALLIIGTSGFQNGGAWGKCPIVFA
jgi:hypothetical protein